MTFRVLVTDETDAEGVALLRATPGFTVDVVPTLKPDALAQRIGDYDALICRSATKVTAEVLRAGTRLQVVGRAGTGIDNVDVGAATALGVAVLNAPAGNAIAVAELFFAGILALLRRIPEAVASMQEGHWERARFLGNELHGRTLGIVGFARIGGEVAVRAQAFGMTVVAYDPYIPAERFEQLQVRRATTLDELLGVSDILTLHLPLTDDTRGLIGAAELARLPEGAIVVNMARGGILDDEALLDALHAGRLGGAVLDVYAHEPVTGNHPYRGVQRLVVTPHIGASTEEAQRSVAVDACAAVRDLLVRGDLSRSLNAAMATVPADGLADALRLARRLAHVARATLHDRTAGAADRLTLTVGADFAGARDALLASAAVGALEGVVSGERLNVINARARAAERGLTTAVGVGGAPVHARAIDVRLAANGDETHVEGVAIAGVPPRLTRFGPFVVDVVPRGTLIVLTNDDVPGVIGRVGTALGGLGLNIAEYHQSRVNAGGEALAVISIDGVPPPRTRETLLALQDVRSATVIPFGAA